MALTVGTKAPDFSLPTKTAEGAKQIKLSEISGRPHAPFFFHAFTACAHGDLQPGPEVELRGMKAAVYGSGDSPFAQESCPEGKITVPLLTITRQIAKNP